MDETPPAASGDIIGARALLVLGNDVTTDHISPGGAIPSDAPAGRYLIENGVQPAQFSSYVARRANHEVMVRGTFANIRLRNKLAPGTEGGFTRYGSEITTVHAASERYRTEGVPMIVVAGSNYGCGSSRDWAAKGTRLLGIQAVIAESFERIHRSNLIGMGVLPLQLPPGTTADSLSLDGQRNVRHHRPVRRHRPRPGRHALHPPPRRRNDVCCADLPRRHHRRSGLAAPRRHPAERPAQPDSRSHRMISLMTRRQALSAAAAMTVPAVARAETNQLRISYGYSTGYLPLMVMRDQRLIEKHAAQAGLGDVAISWMVLDGGNNINDAMLSGALDIAGLGVPGYLVLRDRTLGRKQEVIGISALTSGALWLNTIEPRIKSLADYTPNDRIAVPGIKTSFAAVVLEMAVAKQFGIENYAKLDPNTVGIPHPDAYAAMMSGKTEITSHLASAPFSYLELKNPKVHRVLTTRDVIGPMSILMTMSQRQFADANPGLIKAFLTAQEEANAFIASDHEGAAAAYVRVSGTKTPHDEVIQVLADPENEYSVVPSGSLNYARFLSAIGTLKEKPAAWTDLFLPNIKDRNGS